MVHNMVAKVQKLILITKHKNKKLIPISDF